MLNGERGGLPISDSQLPIDPKREPERSDDQYCDRQRADNQSRRCEPAYKTTQNTLPSSHLMW